MALRNVWCYNFVEALHGKLLDSKIKLCMLFVEIRYVCRMVTLSVTINVCLDTINSL